MVNPSADIKCFCKFCTSITPSKRNSSKLTNKKLARLLLIASVTAVLQHRIDGLENSAMGQPCTERLQHRIDGLETTVVNDTYAYYLQHRIDGLENVII